VGSRSQHSILWTEPPPPCTEDDWNKLVAGPPRLEDLLGRMTRVGNDEDDQLCDIAGTTRAVLSAS
jgi:hypothetical protein